MLEIKTILTSSNEHEEFDEKVNDALRNGWELVRRDVLPPFEGDTRFWCRLLYAELEREVEPKEPEETEDDSVAEWRITRNPILPYKCTACGAAYEKPSETCPSCKRVMTRMEVRR